MTVHYQRADDGKIPDDRRGVRKKKFSMAVKDSQAPGGQNQQSDAGKEDANKLDGQPARLTVKSGGNSVDQIGRCQDSGEDQGRRDQRKQGKDCACNPSRVFSFLLGYQLGINRYKRCRQDAFAKEVLQKVGDAHRRAKCVGGIIESEEMGKDPITNQAGDAAEKNTGCNQKSAASDTLMRGPRCAGIVSHSQLL